MAFHIEISRAGAVNYNELLQLCSKLNREHLTIFPLCGDRKGIGLAISIHCDIEELWPKLEDLIRVTIKKDFGVHELYNGTELSEVNLPKLKEMLI